MRGFELRVAEAVRATLGEVVGLRGELAQDGARLAVERASATRAVVAALQVHAGSAVIASEAAITFEELHGSLRHDPPGDVRCELRAGRAEAVALRLAVGELALVGRVELGGARLRIDGPHGAVFAERVTLSGLVLELPGIRLELDAIEAGTVAIEWGPAGVRVRAASATLGAAGLAATIPAPTAAPIAASAAAPAPSAGVPLPPAVQRLLPLLDGLAGQLDVDLGLDLTVPVIGRRRATHKFRIPIDGGALDYLALEGDLSKLEDALLDFALRDGGLVLEMGIPLMPTRGKGKPILRWDLEGDDLALARRNRIRLAMLPRLQVVAADGGKARVALRELSLRNLDGKLRLAHDRPPAALPLRRVGELAVRADVHHAVEARPRDGTATARIAGVELGPLRAPLGAMTLGFGAATLATADVGAELAGLQPRTVRAALRGLALADLDLTTIAPPG